MTDTLIIREDEDSTLRVVLLHADTRKALSERVARANWQSSRGTIYSKSAQLLRAYHIPDTASRAAQWVGVVVMGAYRHV